MKMNILSWTHVSLSCHHYAMPSLQLIRHLPFLLRHWHAVLPVFCHIPIVWPKTAREGVATEEGEDLAYVYHSTTKTLEREAGMEKRETSRRRKCCLNRGRWRGVLELWKALCKWCWSVYTGQTRNVKELKCRSKSSICVKQIEKFAESYRDSQW